MARASQRPASQPPQQQYRGQERKPSGFIPAQRTIPPSPSQPPRVEYREPEEEQEEGRDITPRTKSGYPDRRFRGQRDLPPPPEGETGTRARTGGMVGDMHITIDGKPDRRFKENRSLSEEELNARWLDELNERYGRGRR